MNPIFPPSRPWPLLHFQAGIALVVRLATLCAAAVTPSLGLADYYSEIPSTTWVKAGPASTMAQPPNGITAFSGMAIDESNGQILLFGGGHSDYWGNEVWAWTMSARTWRKMYEPDALHNVSLSACQASVDNTNRPGMWTPSGRPISRHTYDSVEYISHLGLMMAGGSSTYSGANEYLWSDTRPSGSGCYFNSPGDVWFYNPNTNAWSYKGSSQVDKTRVGIGVSAYDSTTRQVIVLGRTANYELTTHIYDPTANTFQQKFPASNPPWHGEIAATYDSKRHYVLFFGGEYSNSDKLWAYSVDQNTWIDLSPATGMRPTAGGGYGIAYDSAADVIVVYGRSGLWVYDYGTKAWSQPKTVISPQMTSQVHGKFKYDRQRNVTFLVFSNSQWQIEVWAYRHKAVATDQAR